MHIFVGARLFISMSIVCILTSWQAALAIGVGETIDFDRVTSNNPDLGAWDRGVVIGTTTIAGKMHFKIRNQAGTPYTIPNDPRWVRAIDPSSTAPAPDGCHPGPYPGTEAFAPVYPGAVPASTGGYQPSGAQPGRGSVSGAGGQTQAGATVEFDRVEGSKPEFSRWEHGVVVGRDQWGRVQIRADNGIIYNIKDDPRWILPGGSPLPGRRHDYLQQPTSPAAATPVGGANRGTMGGGGSERGTTGGGGSAGALAGEWAVVGVDGRPASGYGMTFNFVGSRYELIHYSGQTEAGSFSVNGSSIRMIQEDGSEYATFQYSIQGNRLVLKAPGSEFVCERAHK